jgi:hypothetical protein
MLYVKKKNEFMQKKKGKKEFVVSAAAQLLTFYKVPLNRTCVKMEIFNAFTF